MALNRDEHLKIKLDELDGLKKAMGGFNAERLAKVKGHSAEAPDAGDEEGGEHDPSLEKEMHESEDVKDVTGKTACPECGEEVETGEQTCPHCGAEMEQEGGGEEGGEASDEEDTDAARLAEVADEKQHRHGRY